MRQAAVDVVLEQQQRHLVGRRGQRLDLLQDVEAVRLLVDEALEAPSLALDPPQAGDEVPLVLRVAVAEMGAVAGRSSYCGAVWAGVPGRSIERLAPNRG